jgi:hypothetical protein
VNPLLKHHFAEKRIGEKWDKKRKKEKKKR